MRGVLQLESGLLIFRHAGQHAVEDVIVSLARVLRHDAGFLQEVLLDIRALDRALLVEADVDVLAEARRVVVAVRLGVAERLEDRVRLQQHVLHAAKQS